MRARLASMGLVATCGFLLAVSLATSAALSALSTYMAYVLPNVQVVVNIFDVLMSAILIGGMFAAMFKVLPDTDIAWRDVAVGAVAETPMPRVSMPADLARAMMASPSVSAPTRATMAVGTPSRARLVATLSPTPPIMARTVPGLEEPATAGALLRPIRSTVAPPKTVT